MGSLLANRASCSRLQKAHYRCPRLHLSGLRLVSLHVLWLYPRNQHLHRFCMPSLSVARGERGASSGKLNDCKVYKHIYVKLSASITAHIFLVCMHHMSAFRFVSHDVSSCGRRWESM